MPHKKTIASETDARKMQSFARLGGLKEDPASIGGEYFTIVIEDVDINDNGDQEYWVYLLYT